MHKELLQKLKVLAYYQIVGGVIGLCAILYGLITQPNTEGALFVFSLACGLYIFSLWCGWTLLKNVSKGLTFSLINQSLQVIVFIFGSYTFKYIAGVSLLVALNLTEGAKLSFDIELSAFQFNFNSSTEGLVVGMNVIAFYLVYFISQAKDKLKERELLVEKTTE